MDDEPGMNTAETRDNEELQQAPSEPAAGRPSTPGDDDPAALREQIEALNDKYLRAVAEMRNSQQRAQRDKAEALRYAEADFARELLVVLDDLERTQDSARAAATLEAVLEGVRIVQEHFLNVLKKRGIEPIDAVGRPFDPSLHEAMLQQPSAEHPAGIVIQELARGFRMHERVIRAARVIVSSGPPAAGDAQSSGDQ